MVILIYARLLLTSASDVWVSSVHESFGTSGKLPKYDHLNFDQNNEYQSDFQQSSIQQIIFNFCY